MKGKKLEADFFFIQIDNLFMFESYYSINTFTLESGIDVGQEITVGPGKFGKKNKRRAFNKCRAWTKSANLCYKKPSNLKISEDPEKNSKI